MSDGRITTANVNFDYSPIATCAALLDTWSIAVPQTKTDFMDSIVNSLKRDQTLRNTVGTVGVGLAAFIAHCDRHNQQTTITMLPNGDYHFQTPGTPPLADNHVGPTTLQNIKAALQLIKLVRNE